MSFISSSFDISFWRSISKRKLTEQKLSEDGYLGYGSMNLKNTKTVVSFTSEVLNDPLVSKSEILVSGSILTDLKFKTMVLLSTTVVAKRVINNPKKFWIVNPKNNKIESGFFIASNNEFERYKAVISAEEFYQMTKKENRKKLIVPGG